MDPIHFTKYKRDAKQENLTCSKSLYSPKKKKFEIWKATNQKFKVKVEMDNKRERNERKYENYLKYFIVSKPI